MVSIVLSIQVVKITTPLEKLNILDMFVVCCCFVDSLKRKKKMSADDLVIAAKNGEFDEVVRCVDEEHVDVDSRDIVSFFF